MRGLVTIKRALLYIIVSVCIIGTMMVGLQKVKRDMNTIDVYDTEETYHVLSHAELEDIVGTGFADYIDRMNAGDVIDVSILNDSRRNAQILVTFDNLDIYSIEYSDGSYTDNIINVLEENTD